MLAEALAQAAAPKGKRLLVDCILDALPEQERDVLLAALHDPRYSARAIADALTAEGHPIQDGAVCNWRARNAR